jgi:hypothetical protein
MSNDRVVLSFYWVLLSIMACANSVAGEREDLATASGNHRIASTNLSALLANAIAKRYTEDGFNGTVLVSRDGETVLHQTLGALSLTSINRRTTWCEDC